MLQLTVLNSVVLCMTSSPALATAGRFLGVPPDDKIKLDRMVSHDTVNILIIDLISREGQIPKNKSLLKIGNAKYLINKLF